MLSEDIMAKTNFYTAADYPGQFDYDAKYKAVLGKIQDEFEKRDVLDKSFYETPTVAIGTPATTVALTWPGSLGALVNGKRVTAAVTWTGFITAGTYYLMIDETGAAQKGTAPNVNYIIVGTVYCNGSTLSSLAVSAVRGKVGASGGSGTATITYRGTWAADIGYAVGDWVSYGGGSYQCILAHTSGASTEPGVGASWETNWGQLAEKGATGAAGAAGAGINPRGTWISGTAYAAGDAVISTVDGCGYVCKTGQVHTAAEGNKAGSVGGNTYWTKYNERGPTGTGIQGAGFTDMGTWTEAVDYEKTASNSDLVLRLGAIYECLVSHTADTTNRPGDGSGTWQTYWKVFIPAAQPSGTLVPKGAWAATTEYVRDADTVDWVSNAHGSWYCILSHTAASTNEPGVGADYETYWLQLAPRGLQGETGATGATGADGADGAPGTPGANGLNPVHLGQWLPDTDYTEGIHEVRWGDSSYRCKTSHTSVDGSYPTSESGGPLWELAARGGGISAVGTTPTGNLAAFDEDDNLVDGGKKNVSTDDAFIIGNGSATTDKRMRFDIGAEGTDYTGNPGIGFNHTTNKMVFSNGSDVWEEIGTGTGSSTPPNCLDNLLTNPDGGINQRNGATETPCADATYHHDRWYALSESAPVTAAKTLTTTGTGTTRTATASASTFSADNVGGYIRTPTGWYQITAYTSATVVSIATATGYSNESGVTFSVGTITTQRVDGTGDARFAMQLKNAQATAQRIGTAQIIEASNSIPHRGKSLRLQLAVKPSAAVAIRAAVLEWTGTADTFVSRDVVYDWANTQYDPQPWQATHTYSLGDFVVPTTENNLFYECTVAGESGSSEPTWPGTPESTVGDGTVTWTARVGAFFLSANWRILGTASASPGSDTWGDLELTVTPGAAANNLAVCYWTESAVAQGATVQVTKCRLCSGSENRVWIPRPIAEELVICQRYAWCIGGDSANETLAVGEVLNATTAIGYVKTPVPMRIQPVIEYKVATDWQIFSSAAATACTNIFLNHPDTTGKSHILLAANVSGGLTAYRLAAIRASTISAKLVFSAEL
jgi:hypothetical protein